MNLSIVINLISAIYVLFLPGFFLTFLFFKPGHVHITERLVLSFGLSIAVVPIVVFYTSLLNIPITSLTVMINATGIIFVTGIILFVLYKKTQV